ncbi:DNA translocase FtsK [Psychrobacillus sp. OK032]|uniref:DNA translocase FtsK n=1 Tax=Psychrobacillus sp. OK032 TaxID=1884358 RepID=UPI0008B3FAE8|nr:DNA translocase FtsK [Psychrobacillus sp. OK032]SER91797.1 DNA segregation ATPase FtsK/SpoIIIE, S-DNA-T family [Psychrobacillus sp. OK032]
MNWFKKLFGLNEEDNSEEIEVEEKTVSTTRSKTPFRFPLISDDEKNETVFEQPQPNEEKTIHEPFIEKPLTEEPLYKPLYTQDKWQQRKQPTIIHRSDKITVDDTPAIIRKKRAFTPSEVPSPVYGFSKKSRESSNSIENPPVDNAPIRTIQETWQQRKIQKVEQRQVKNTTDDIITAASKKRAFTPTEVPSPIYGFSKNREKQLPIEDKVEKETKIEEVIVKVTPVSTILEQMAKEEVTPTLLKTEESVSTLELVQEEKTEVQEETPEVQEETPEVPEATLEVQAEKPEVPEAKPEVQEETPEVLEEKPEVQAETPEVPEAKPEVQEETPEVPEAKPEVQEETPEVLEEKPEVQAEKPEVLEEKPEVQEETPEVQEETPEVPEATLEIQAEKPEVLEEKPEVQEETPEVLEAKPEVQEETPEVRKENIRPFNVLMLKSDKQHIEKAMIKKEGKIEEPIKVEAPSAVVLEAIATEETAATLAEEQPSTVLEQAEEEEPEVKKENIRPFNVLMLKSDKQKMNRLNINNVHQPVAQKPKEKNEVPEISPNEKEEQVEQEIVPSNNYTRPSFSYLLPPEMKDDDKEWMEEQAYTLVEALSHFQVTGEIVQMVQGPAVTQFELTVGHGTKVSKIRNLADDLKLALAAKDIRIQAPIPGKRSIGIEIPNRTSRAVRLSEVLNTEVFVQSDSPLEAALGLDLTGKPVTLDLRKMPHGLIAGATGSGKSVFINSLLVSLLYKATPEEVKLLLIDPKMVELAPFNHIPHLVSPVITDVKAATAALKWAVEEMERRYQLFAHIGVRDISRYNTLATEKRKFAQKLPYLVIVIDELADLMMMAPAEVEDAICRIAQKARACGIHLVLATQRPSVDVITGLIKANIPTRIAFSVSSQIDSRTILDQQGAERLLGKGDMLYQGNGMSSPVRIQGTYVTDDEIEAVIAYARSQGTPEYIFEQEELLQRAEISEQDELFEEACRFVVEQGTASTSLLQRKFHIGYNRAARLIDSMYESGYITEQRGSKARDVLLTNDSLEQIFS